MRIPTGFRGDQWRHVVRIPLAILAVGYLGAFIGFAQLYVQYSIKFGVVRFTEEVVRQFK